MTEQQLIETFTESTRLHANEGTEHGLHPLHVSNVLLLAALQIAVQFEGIENARQGLLRAAAELGA